MDYGPDDNLVEAFTRRWLDRDRFVTKASVVCTIHEMEATEVWADKNGTERKLVFEEWWPEDDGDGDGNVPQQPQWASQMKFWGSLLMVTWCMVESLPTATGTPQNRTFRRACMLMASQDTVFGSDVLISHAPISLAPTGARLSLTRMPFAPCVGRSSKN